MKTKNQRAEQRKLKKLKHVQDIAEAFLKARGTYPPDIELFDEMAPKKESDCFYATMYLCDKASKDLGYSFDYLYNELCQEWTFYFLNDLGEALHVIERETGFELVCIG